MTGFAAGAAGAADAGGRALHALATSTSDTLAHHSTTMPSTCISPSPHPHPPFRSSHPSTVLSPTRHPPPPSRDQLRQHELQHPHPPHSPPLPPHPLPPLPITSLLTPSTSPTPPYPSTFPLALFVSCANLTSALEKCSSKSNSSSGGGGRSRSVGWKIAGRKGRGTSNWGGMRDKGVCWTWRVSYRAMASGMREVSNLNRRVSNRDVKSRGRSSGSCRQERSRSEREAVSGRGVVARLRMVRVDTLSQSTASAMCEDVDEGGEEGGVAVAGRASSNRWKEPTTRSWPPPTRA